MQQAAALNPDLSRDQKVKAFNSYIFTKLSKLGFLKELTV